MGAKLKVQEAAEWMGVSEQTIRNHINNGLLRPASAQPTRLSVADLRKAKILLESDIVGNPKFGIERPVWREAKAAGAIVPSSRDRYSRDDVDRVVHGPPWGAAPSAADQAAPPPLRPSEVNESSGCVAAREAMIAHYLRKRLSPAALPDEYWLTAGPPPFVSPTGIFRYVYLHWDVSPARKVIGIVRRSEGHEIGSDGEPRPTSEAHLALEASALAAPEVPSPGMPEAGFVPVCFREENRRWYECRREWFLAWEARAELRAALKARGGSSLCLPSGPLVDRRAALVEYHRWYLSPSQLPAYFWDTPVMPPFEPPTDVARYRMGDTFRFQNNGEVGTQIVRPAGWYTDQAFPYEPRYFPEAPDYLPLTGELPQGTLPPGYEDVELAHEEAKLEWEQAWRRFGAGLGRLRRPLWRFRAPTAGGTRGAKRRARPVSTSLPR